MYVIWGGKVPSGDRGDCHSGILQCAPFDLKKRSRVLLPIITFLPLTCETRGLSCDAIRAISESMKPRYLTKVDDDPKRSVLKFGSRVDSGERSCMQDLDSLLSCVNSACSFVVRNVGPFWREV